METDEEELLVTKYDEECRGVVQCETRLGVRGHTQSAITVSEMSSDMSIHSTIMLQQIEYLMLSRYESTGRVWRLLRTIYGQVRIIDIVRYLRHIGFVTSDDNNHRDEWRSDNGLVLIALYVDDLLVTVSEGLVTGTEDKYLQDTDFVTTDIEIMRGGDYRQADSVMSRVSGFLDLVKPTKHIDTKYRCVQQMIVQAANAPVTEMSRIECMCA